MSNLVNRFYTAVSVLAGHGHIKQRLIEAYEDSLAPIEDDDMPLALRQSFADLRTEMNHVDPLNGEGPICASVRKLSVAEADQCARRILDLYGDMLRLVDNAQENLPLHAKNQPSVPSFLAKAN